MEAILQFILDLFLNNGIIIAVATFIIGEITKGLAVPNKFIPLIGGIIGTILGLTIPGLFEGRDIITSGILGLALGWAATGGYETVKQLIKKED